MPTSSLTESPGAGSTNWRERLADLLPPAEAAAILGVTSGTLEVWRCTRRYPLPYVKVGRKVMYRRADLLAFINSRTVGATSENREA